MRLRVAAAILGLFLAITALPSPGRAQGVELDPLVAPLRENLLYARYPEVVTGAGLLLARPDLTASQRVQVLEALAIAHLAQNETAAAQSTLTELFRRDPGHRLTDPDASPVVLSAFARAREAHPPPVDVTIEHQPLGRLPRREAPTVVVRFSAGRDAVHEARIAYRARGGARWDTLLVAIDAEGVGRATIPVTGPSDRSAELEYWIEAVAPSGAQLAQLGTPESPLQVSVPAQTREVQVIRVQTPGGRPARRGVLQQWWFWTAVGAVVVGGAVAGYVLLGPPSQGPDDGSLGNVTLR